MKWIKGASNVSPQIHPSECLISRPDPARSRIEQGCFSIKNSSATTAHRDGFALPSSQSLFCAFLRPISLPLCGLCASSEHSERAWKSSFILHPIWIRFLTADDSDSADLTWGAGSKKIPSADICDIRGQKLFQSRPGRRKMGRMIFRQNNSNG